MTRTNRDVYRGLPVLGSKDTTVLMYLWSEVN